MSTTIHTSIDVRGVLAWKDRELKGMFNRDGRKLSGPECREVLLDCLQDGILRISMGPRCEGFSEQTGCPGHKVKDDKEMSDGPEDH